MTEVKQFKTGMWFAEEPEYYNHRFNGRGWNIIFIEGKLSDGGINVDGVTHRNKEIAICAKNWKTAQQATNLIYSSLVLEMSDTLGGIISSFSPVAYSEEEDMIENLPSSISETIKNHYLCNPDLSMACLIALKASYNKHFCYAISKYNLCCEIYSTASVDLDPFHSKNMNLSPFYDDHVRFASSITLAYSAIEELNLHIKASDKNPSKLPNGEWNPKVKSNLECRLSKAGVDNEELFLWNLRGPSRKIDKKRPPKAISRPYWSGSSVRDVEVNIIDAINDASWLRSRVSAHGFSQLTPSLSPYDVANVQHLARRLILESLGFWRYRFKESIRKRTLKSQKMKKN